MYMFVYTYIYILFCFVLDSVAASFHSLKKNYSGLSPKRLPQDMKNGRKKLHD